MNFEKRLQEIEQRKLEIRQLLEDETKDVDFDELEVELRRLEEEKKDIEKRMAIAKDIEAGKEPGRKIPKPEGSRDFRMFEVNEIVKTPEYRSAYLKNLQGQELTEIEKRAFTTALDSVGAVIPTTTLNKVMEVIRQHAPLLDEVNLLQVPGGVRVPVEDVVSEAILHAENAVITPADDKVKFVDLFGYEITKLLQISKSVKSMAIDAFENWLSNNLGRALAAKITSLIINGTGVGEAAGINKITWNENNSVVVAASSSLTLTDVTNLIALLPGGYDANAKFLMSKKTLFADFMPLKDSSKHDLVTREGNKYFIYGYPVLLDERIPFHEAFLGDFKTGYYANMPEEINITTQFDINTNSYKYLGTAMFDGKVVQPAAFVKLIKATA